MIASRPARTMWAALVTIYLTWGSLYLAIRFVVDEAPPMLSMALRFLLAALILAGITVSRRGVGALRVAPAELIGAFLLGALLLGIGNGFNALGQNLGVPSGVTALLCSTVPLFITGIRFATGTRPHPVGLLAIGLGLVGVAYLVFDGDAFPDAVPAVGVVCVLCAAFGWALGSVLVTYPKIRRPGDPWANTAYQLLGATGSLVVLSILRREPLDLTMDAKGWGGMLYLVIVGSVLSFTIYQWLLANAPLDLVATHTYVNPVVAVALGAMVAAEPLGPSVFIGGGLVVAAVVLTVLADARTHARDHVGVEVT